MSSPLAWQRILHLRWGTLRNALQWGNSQQVRVFASLSPVFLPNIPRVITRLRAYRGGAKCAAPFLQVAVWHTHGLAHSVRAARHPAFDHPPVGCLACVPGLFSDVYSKRSAMCGNKTISPDDPAVHEARKAILMFRTFLDVFAPVYPAGPVDGLEDIWAMVRGDIDQVRAKNVGTHARKYTRTRARTQASDPMEIQFLLDPIPSLSLPRP